MCVVAASSLVAGRPTHSGAMGTEFAAARDFSSPFFEPSKVIAVARAPAGLGDAPRSAAASASVSTVVTLTADDDALLQYAESVLTSRCMVARGFEYVATDLSTLQERLNLAYRAAELTAFPYDANREGIPYSDTSEPTVEDPNADYVGGLGEQQLTAYGDALQGFITDRVEVTALGTTMGTPRAGCVSEARASLYGDLESALRSYLLASNLGAIAHAMTRAEPAVQTALDDWSTCMRDMGYDLQDFGQARQLAIDDPELAVAVATADATCTADSDLSTIYRAAHSNAITELIEREPGTFEQVQQSRQAAIERATALLESGELPSSVATDGGG